MPAGQATWQGALGVGGASWTIVRQTCQGLGRSAVRQAKRSPQGEGCSGLSASRVTAESGTQPSSRAGGRLIGPCRATSGVGPSTVARVITTVGHSRMQMPQPMHSPTWTGRSIIQGCGVPRPAASIPGPAGRLMSRASTGQTSMQTAQLRQFAWSISMR